MNSVPDQIWANVAVFANGEALAGEWNYRDVGRDDDIQYVRAAPARLHAEELADLLREALEELDDYYRAEYDTDHPYHQDKLSRARDSWAHARALLARIEGEKP